MHLLTMVASSLTYVSRTTPVHASIFDPLDTVIAHEFLPVLKLPSEHLALFGLPAKHGGLGIPSLSLWSTKNYEMSKLITSPLVAAGTSGLGNPPSAEDCRAARLSAHKLSEEEHTLHRNHVLDELHLTNLEMFRVVKDLSIESPREFPFKFPRDSSLPPEPHGPHPAKGTSLMFTALPSKELGLSFSRFDFLDLLAIRYHLPHANLPTHCSCKDHPVFTQNHGETCSKGGLLIWRHNEIRDFLASAFNLICHAHVATEPQLHPLHAADAFALRSANVEEKAKSDVLLVEGLFSDNRLTYIDVRCFNRSADSYVRLSLDQCLASQERTKRNQYAERIDVVEHADFSPFVVSSSGAVGPAAHHILQIIASRIASKTDQPYSETLMLLRTQLSFHIAKAAIRCLRAPREPPKNLTTDIWALSPFYAGCLTGMGAPLP